MEILSIQKLEQKCTDILDWYSVEVRCESLKCFVNIPIEPKKRSLDELQREIVSKAKREIHNHWDLIEAHHGHLCLIQNSEDK